MLGIHHLSIGQRLALGFALTLGFTAAVAAYAWGQLAEVNAEVKLLVDDRVVKFEQLEEVSNHPLHGVACRVGRCSRTSVTNQVWHQQGMLCGKGCR